MADQQITQETSSHVDAPFRMDVKLHEILMEPKQAEKRTTLQPKGLTLPQPVYPQREGIVKLRASRPIRPQDMV